MNQDVSNWEKHLSNIIGQTNKNIEFLSKSAKSKREVSAIYNNPPLPPAPPILLTSVAGHTSCQVAKPQLARIVPPSLQPAPDYFQKHAKEIINASRGVGVISRPLETQVEDDLTRKIGQSVKRTVERTMSEKSQISQARVDRLFDYVEHLKEDTKKLRRDHHALSRLTASQDRLSKRLKDEWEKQRNMVKTLEAAMTKDLGWKESTTIDLKILKDQQLQDSTLRVTGDEVRSSMETITSKIMVAVDRATAALRDTFESDILKLNDENKILRENFNESRVRTIISNAVESHLSRVQSKISCSIRSSIIHDIRASEERINASILTKSHDVFDQRSMEDNAEATKDSELIHNLITNGDFETHINALITAQLNKCKTYLLQQSKRDIERSKIDRDKMKDMVNQTINEMRSMMENTKHGESSYEDLTSRVLSLEQEKQNVSAINADNFRTDVETILRNGEIRNYSKINEIASDISMIKNGLKTCMKTSCTLRECMEQREINHHSTLAKIIQLSERIDSFEKAPEEAGILEKEEYRVSIGRIDRIGKQINQLDSDILSIKNQPTSIDQRLHEVEDLVRHMITEKLKHLSDDTDTQIVNHVNDIQKEIYILKEDLFKLKVSDDRAKSSVADLVSCYGKISALENNTKTDLSTLRNEFVHLQDNIIDIHSTSQEIIDTVAKDIRQEIMPMISTKGTELHVVREKAEYEISQQAYLKSLEAKIMCLEKDVALIRGQDANAFVLPNALNEAQAKLKDEECFRTSIENSFKLVQQRISKLEKRGKGKVNVQRHYTLDNGNEIDKYQIVKQNDAQRWVCIERNEFLTDKYPPSANRAPVPVAHPSFEIGEIIEGDIKQYDLIVQLQRKEGISPTPYLLEELCRDSLCERELNNANIFQNSSMDKNSNSYDSSFDSEI